MKPISVENREVYCFSFSSCKPWGYLWIKDTSLLTLSEKEIVKENGNPLAIISYSLMKYFIVPNTGDFSDFP